MVNQFSNLSCYSEFEMRCALTGISKIDILKEIGQQIDNYYFFVSNDGVFNWFDLDGNHVENPGILSIIDRKYIPRNIIKCIIPNGVTNIGVSAFQYCKLLKEITIPDSVTSISIDVFSGCKSLVSITIPDSVTSIGKYAFVHCVSLKEINIHNGVTSIGDDVFYGCKSLTSVSISDSVTSIGHNTFYGCKSLTSVSIPDSVTSIGSRVFSGCNSLKEIIFKGKNLDEVIKMWNYPFGIEDESIIKCEM